MHVSAKSWFHVSFPKAKATNSIIIYSGLSRKFKIIDSQLACLKHKYKDFGLTLFWEFKANDVYDPWFHDEIFADILCNTPTIPRIVFNYKDKNLRENFTGFLSYTVIISNQTLHINPPATLRAQLNKTSDNGVIHLVKEIGDINKYKIKQKNYFLYDNSNMIEATFFSEFNKKILIYGLISYFSDDKKILQK